VFDKLQKAKEGKDELLIYTLEEALCSMKQPTAGTGFCRSIGNDPGYGKCPAQFAHGKFSGESSRITASARTLRFLAAPGRNYRQKAASRFYGTPIA
jgi:hypothetical protein